MRNATVGAIRAKYENLEPGLDERARRLWTATEARAIGWGGISQVSEATGLSRITIKAGLSERDLPRPRPPSGRLPVIGYAAPEVDGSPSAITTPTSAVTWRPWSIP